VLALGGTLLVSDGAVQRAATRLGPRGDLSRVRWEDPPSGRSVEALVGRGALVRLRAGQERDAAFARLHLKLKRALGRDLFLVEHLGADDGLDLAVRLQRDAPPEIAEVMPDLHLPHTLKTFDAPPNDPRYPGEWFFQKIGLETVWKRQTGSRDVTIVVVDTGCDKNHPDLRDKLDPGLDTFDGDDDPSPVQTRAGDAHGTACAGIVGASTNNALGIAGACPDCRIRCVRLLTGDNGPIPVSGDIEAFNFARDVGAAVVSNSWGFSSAIPVPAMLAAAIEDVSDHGRGGLGALVVFAAGNDNRMINDDELEAVRGVLNVGAVNNFGEVTSFSNSGNSLDVVAPTGTNTTDLVGAGGMDPSDYTNAFGGTSSACPVVAGVAGLLASAAPDKRASEISDALVGTARQSPFAKPDGMGHDLFYGFGQIDPPAALERLAPAPPPPEPSGCSFAPGSGGIALLGFLLLAVRLRRRR
jgi:subtilisin family serine protease